MKNLGTGTNEDGTVSNNKHYIPNLKSKIASGIIMGAIGDALGVPVEMMSKEQIAENFGRVKTYLTSKINGSFKALGFDKEGGGYVSDDTLLSLALIRSFLNQGKLDTKDILIESWETYTKLPYGFGGSTRYGMENISKGVPIEESGKKDAAGNGVVMKQFPLAVIHAVQGTSREERDEFIEKYTRATHNSDIAVVASILHDEFLVRLLKTDSISKADLIDELIKFVKPYEEKFLEGRDDLSKMLGRIRSNINMTDQEILDEFGWGDNVKGGREGIMQSGYVVTTLGIVYAIFLRNSDNFDAVIDAVNIGGDVDSYASMVGSMLGAYRGIEAPNELIIGLQKKDEIISTINAFLTILFEDDQTEHTCDNR